MRQTIDRLDYTTRDYEGFRQLMLNKLTELLPEYTDHRQSDAGIVILELNAMCLDILSYYLDSVAKRGVYPNILQNFIILLLCSAVTRKHSLATLSR